MGGYYQVDDTSQLYGAGQATASVSEDAWAARESIQSALEAVTPGSKHNANVVLQACQAFAEDVREDARSLANGAESLGNQTSDAAATVQQSSNEATALQNQGTSLNRQVNAGASSALAI